MTLIISITAGLIVGLTYFSLLCLSTRPALRHPRWAVLLIVGRIPRLALFAVVFVAVSRNGIDQGMAMLAGFWVGRQYVLIRVKGAFHGW